MVQYRRRAKGGLDEPLGRWLAWFDGSPPELVREAVWAYWRRTMTLCDYTASMNGATEKGRAKGRSGEKLDITRKMKEMGISAEQIQIITGLLPETVAGSGEWGSGS